MVSKMPALHPGDVRKLQAVSVSGLEHLCDVIVFPRKVTKTECERIHALTAFQSF